MKNGMRQSVARQRSATGLLWGLGHLERQRFTDVSVPKSFGWHFRRDAAEDSLWIFYRNSSIYIIPPPPSLQRIWYFHHLRGASFWSPSGRGVHNFI